MTEASEVGSRNRIIAAYLRALQGPRASVMGLSEEAASRLQRWATACRGYRKLAPSRISKGRQTMLQPLGSEEDLSRAHLPVLPDRTLLSVRQDHNGNKELWLVQHPSVVVAAADDDADVTATAQEDSRTLTSMLSFRRTGRRRKRREVVGGAMLDNPSWPAVLLTYERGVSPVGNSPHALLKTV